MVRLIHFAHWAILFFVLTAWAWPWPQVQWVHLIFVPLMIAHWKTNQNRCVLSQLEERFRPAGEAAVVVEESQFIKLVWKKCFGNIPSAKTLERAIYAITIFAWFLSAARITAGFVRA